MGKKLSVSLAGQYEVYKWSIFFSYVEPVRNVFNAIKSSKCLMYFLFRFHVIFIPIETVVIYAKQNYQR